MSSTDSGRLFAKGLKHKRRRIMLSNNNDNTDGNSISENHTFRTDFETLEVESDAGFHTLWLNRPQVKNAMNQTMVQELITFFGQCSKGQTDKVNAGGANARAIIIRGRGDIFCAGADIKDMAKARQNLANTSNRDYENNAIYGLNRAFGTLMMKVQACPAVVICAVQGAALGGGFGLMCTADITLVTESAKLGMPETRLGILPAQIAPFVVQRIGLTRAKEIALLGQKISGHRAYTLGIAQQCLEQTDDFEGAIAELKSQIRYCAPQANALTKTLLQNSAYGVNEKLLDNAAAAFTDAMLSEEGQEGSLAFMQKRAPSWA